jgi:hypothetical protein
VSDECLDTFKNAESTPALSETFSPSLPVRERERERDKERQREIEIERDKERGR